MRASDDGIGHAAARNDAPVRSSPADSMHALLCCSPSVACLPVSTSHATMLAPATGELPKMYKARWANDSDNNDSSDTEDICITVFDDEQKAERNVCGQASFDSVEDGMVSVAVFSWWLNEWTYSSVWALARVCTDLCERRRQVGLPAIRAHPLPLCATHEPPVSALPRTVSARVW